MTCLIGALAPTMALAGQQPVTYNQHIAPILFDNCIGCHRPGGSAPFSLLAYSDAVEHARRIVRAVNARLMPPWLPDSGYGTFAGERRLTQAQRRLIRQWVTDGMPEGEGDRVITPGRPARWQLGAPDLIVRMPRFVMPPHERDVYRNLVVTLPISETEFVKSVELIPGGTNVVHHARMMVDTTESSRILDANDPGPGFDGMDLLSNAVNPDGFFVGWTPGKVPHESRDGLAWRIDPGTDLVLQVHLPASDEPQEVEPQVGFRFSASKPARQPVLIMLGSFDIDIPPGDSAYTVTDSYELPVPVSALAIYPHAHYLGKRIEGFAQLPDGRTEWLIRISNWDFNWQDEYHFAEPVDLPAGSILTMRITYDNSAGNPHNPSDPPRRVVYGSNSTDEMADLVVQVLPRRDGDLARLQRDVELWSYTQIVGSIARQEHQRGLAAAASGDMALAVSHFREALANKFDEPAIHNDLGTALTLLGRLDEALAHFQEAARLSPSWAEPVANVARVRLARPEDADGLRDAVRQARRAAELTDRSDAAVLELLARALYASGQNLEAVEVARSALQLAERQGLSDLVQRIRDRLASWR